MNKGDNMDFQYDFDKKMLKATRDFSELSKDFSTKVACFFIKFGQISPSIFSYNGLVRGSNDACNVRAKTRPEKYFWGEHAERNGIYDAARPFLVDTMILCAKFPNMDSARAIVISGIDLVITDFDSALHSEYLKLVAAQNRGLSIEVSEEVLNYERVRTFFYENNITVYHPSRKLAKEGSFVSSPNGVEPEDRVGNARFLRKSIEFLDKVIQYAETFCEGEYKDAAMIVKKNTFASVSIGTHNVPFGFRRFMTVEREAEKALGRSFWYIEAVKDAIYNVVRPVLKDSAAYVSWCPCMDCAMALYSVGTKKVVTVKPEFESEAELRWKEHFSRTEQFFKEVNMNVVYINLSELQKSDV